MRRLLVMKVLVRKDAYFDSVVLMLLSRELKGRPGITDAVVAMGTPMNLSLLASMGCTDGALAAATPNDLVIAVDGADPATVEGTLAAAEASLARKKGPTGSGGGTAHEPVSIEAALEQLPDANIAVISLPGAYAAREARKALDRGLHVMLFSDNVSLEDEIALKTHARSLGLLLMGPDCGSAILNGKPLCFANVVRRGPVGVVAASGTGLQEVTVLVDRAGSGISQAIGTGGRDLKNEKVGGITMLMGIEALAADPETKVIVVVSKPPAPAVAARVVAALEVAGKDAVVHFIGLAPGATAKGSRVRHAGNLEETAALAVALAEGRTAAPNAFTATDAEIAGLVARETAGMASSQRHIRGYFTGGTLADEAWILLHALTGAVWSNNQTDPAFVPADPKTSVGHTVVDLGDDVFTVGRPHPMIDPSTRTERIDAEAGDSSIAVMLVDVVLGYGSHPDPAGALAPSLVAAKRAAEARGGRLSVVASITGTPGDYQGYAGQKATLEAAGVVVMPSNYQASLLAVRIMEKVVANAGGAR
jgi:succinyl-CoA synthetase alpha subunit